MGLAKVIVGTTEGLSVQGSDWEFVCIMIFNIRRD
jgi:hypothetical protein